MKNLSDFFSTEEIKKFLISRGFQIVQKTGEFPHSLHPNIDFKHTVVYFEVLKDGIPYKEKEYLHPDNPNLWIRNVFDEQMKNQLLGMKEEKKEEVEEKNNEKPTMVTLKYSGSHKRFEKEERRRSFADWLANLISVEQKEQIKAYNPNEHNTHFWSIDFFGNNFWVLFDEEDADVFTIKTRYQYHSDILTSLAKYLVFRLRLEEV